MQADLAQQSMPVRQFTRILKAGHIGHQGGARDHVVFECLYDSPIGLRPDPEIVSVYYYFSRWFWGRHFDYCLRHVTTS
jgi:hypothetical protein